jgi:hypothetical protein
MASARAAFAGIIFFAISLRGFSRLLLLQNPARSVRLSQGLVVAGVIGTVMPSALTVLRLMYSSYFCRLLDRQGGLFTFQNSAGIDSNEAMRVRDDVILRSNNPRDRMS